MDTESSGYVELRVYLYSSGECVWFWACPKAPLAPPRSAAAPLSSSKKALSRLRRYIENCRAEYRLFVTLTYPRTFPSAMESKSHLRRWLRALMLSPYGVTSACWVLEFQRRGAPHYHVVVDSAWVPRTFVARSWNRATLGASSIRAGTQVIPCRDSRRDLSRYLAKELSKTLQKQALGSLGPIGRTWGVAGCRECAPVEAATLYCQRFSAQIAAGFVASRARRAFPGGFWWHGVSKHAVVAALTRTGAYDVSGFPDSRLEATRMPDCLPPGPDDCPSLDG